MPNRIREAREAQKLSLEELAQRVGTSRQQIHKLEKGERRLTQEWTRKIAHALGVNPQTILPTDFADNTGLDQLEALEVFLLEKARADAALHRISKAINPRSGVDLDKVDWRVVGTMHNVANDLRCVARHLETMPPPLLQEEASP